MQSDDHQPSAGAGSEAAGPDAAGVSHEPFVADAIEADLAGVEIALARLDAGTYGTDEVTGQPLPEELLHEHPTARRA